MVNFINKLFESERSNNDQNVINDIPDSSGEKTTTLFIRQIGRRHLDPGTPFSLAETRVNINPDISHTVCSATHDAFQKKMGKKQQNNKNLDHEFQMAYSLNCLQSDDPAKWEEANLNIQKMERNAILGTGYWPYNGGYDFVLTSLTTILLQYGHLSDHLPGRLSQETEQYMLDALMNFDDNQAGDKKSAPALIDNTLKQILDLHEGSYDIKCPNTAGMIEESENHTWMILSSLYLIYEYKNRNHHCDPDEIVLTTNAGKTWTNREIKENLEKRVNAFIDYTKKVGCYEFNSRPYVAFTLHALLNLHAFSSGEMKTKVCELLDDLNERYALSSYKFKRFPPFCRNTEKARETSLTDCHHSTYFDVWTASSKSPITSDLGTKGRFKRAPIAASLPYRPKQEVVDRMMDKTIPYLARLGHGDKATAEIYYGGNGVLISAGGAKVEGDHDEVITRPITIITDGDHEELRDVHKLGNILSEEELKDSTKALDFLKMGFHSDCSSFNNTGVYENFACSRGKYVAPNGGIHLANSKSDEMQALIEANGLSTQLVYGKWRVFELNSTSLLAVYSTEKNHNIFERLGKLQKGVKDLGIFAIFNEEEIGRVTPEQLILDIIKANGDDIDLQRQFIFPYSRKKLSYDPDAPNNQWVMISKTEIGESGEEHEVLFNRNFSDWPLLDVSSPTEPVLSQDIKLSESKEETSS
ncbi:MAG: hypothetical protein ACH350_06065 [Parachlamydiaceae bacterium]